MYRSHDVEGTGRCKSEMMYFLVNASPPKLLGVATLNFAGAWVTLYMTKSRSNNVFSCKCIFSKGFFGEIAASNFAGA